MFSKFAYLSKLISTSFCGNFLATSNPLRMKMGEICFGQYKITILGNIFIMLIYSYGKHLNILINLS